MATTYLPEPVDLVFVKHEPSTGADPNKLPLLLGHGVFGNKESWGEIPIKLAEQTQRTVFVIDHRDHGESPRTDEFTFSAMLSDTSKFLEKQGISKAAFCGYSLGGMLFTRFATLWSERVESVIIIDIDPIKKPQEPNLMSGIIQLLNLVLETIRSEKIADLEQARKRADELLQKPIEDEKTRTHLLESLVVREGKIDWSYNLSVITKHWHNLFGFEEIIPKFVQPALEIYGSVSPFMNQDRIPGILESLPNCKFVEVEKADHALPHTHPEKIIEEAVQFLEN